MDDVLSRLERVTTKLEAVQVKLEHAPDGSRIPTPLSPRMALLVSPREPPTSHPITSQEPLTPPSGPSYSVAAFQMILDTELAALTAAAQAIGGDVLGATATFAEGLQREEAVVEAFSTCCKPTDASEMQALLQPVAEKMMAASALSSGPRSTHAEHLKLIGEASQALSWVAYQPGCGLHPPPQHVDDAWSAAEFYANKVLMGWKSKGPEHGAWVGAVKALMAALKQYCSQFHATGPAWNPAGAPVQGFKPSEAGPPGASAKSAPPAAPAPPKKGPPAPPPPPPPPGALLQPKPAAPAAAPAAGSMSALLSELNKGAAITSGLRKVTADMKTKNRSDRSGEVPATTAKAGASAAAAKAPYSVKPTAPPRLECEQGRKWVVENFIGAHDLKIGRTEPKQSVYIYNCRDATVQISGKVNAITLDGCFKVGLLFDTVVATCEIVNCGHVQVQCTGMAPTLAVDKSDGCQLYLSAAAAEAAEITTAKCSEINVVVMAAEGAAEESAEFPIPEQFVSRYCGGKVVTEPVAHSG